MLLINSESNLILNWSAIFVIAPITASDQAATLGITDVITLCSSFSFTK